MSVVPHQHKRQRSSFSYTTPCTSYPSGLRSHLQPPRDGSPVDCGHVRQRRILEGFKTFMLNKNELGVERKFVVSGRSEAGKSIPLLLSSSLLISSLLFSSCQSSSLLTFAFFFSSGFSSFPWKKAFFPLCRKCHDKEYSLGSLRP